MALVETKTLVFSPQYQFFTVRDYGMFEQPGGVEALHAAHTDGIAGSDCEVFVVCAQDALKIRLSVLVYDTTPDILPAGWEDTFRFSLPFPTGTLHAGDLFGTVINMTLPPGRYTVVVQCAGRVEAAAALQREWTAAAELPLDQMRNRLDQWAGLERYQVIVFPGEQVESAGN